MSVYQGNWVNFINSHCEYMVHVKPMIEHLKLERHPEGGYYRETYRSETIIEPAALPSGFTGERNLCTSIYFLLPSGERSLFHRIKSDELWHYHAGSSLTIYVLLNGSLRTHKLGPDLLAGESFQAVIPANSCSVRCVMPPIHLR